MRVALIIGGIFVAVSYVTQLVHPGGVFEESASAASSIALQIGGSCSAPCSWPGWWWHSSPPALPRKPAPSACCMRWAATPSCPKAVFGKLNEKFHAPVANLVITGIVGLDRDLPGLATSTSFINFGAFTAFTLVNASVVFHYVRQRRAGHQLNPVSYVVVPVIGAVICAYLLSQLDSNAITLGLTARPSPPTPPRPTARWPSPPSAGFRGCSSWLSSRR